ncbi:MAG: hypothetical protein Q8Q56_00775 [Alphaproteobacteria bacterium]|nr:hypothetical protein [Alphaproteobacteria bacterium]
MTNNLDSKQYKLIRQLEWFRKKGDDTLVGEETLNKLSLDLIKRLLEIGDENDPELIYDYLIPEDKIMGLQPYINHQIDPKKYQYFYACSAENYTEEKN